MNLSPTQQRQDLRDGLTALLAARRTVDWEELVSSDLGYDPELWSDLVSGGWVTVGFPEADGGHGGGVGDLVVVAEALGRGPVPAPFHGGIVLCGQALLAVSGERDRLRALLSGERTFTNCGWEGFLEQGGRRPVVVATETTPGWQLDGVARFVPYGSDADELLVMADAGAGGDRPGPTLFAVPGSSSGLTTRLVPSVGGDRYCHVTFSGVEVDASQVVGQVGGAMRWLPGVLDVGRVVIAAATTARRWLTDPNTGARAAMRRCQRWRGWSA